MLIPLLFLLVFAGIGLAWILTEDKGRLVMSRTILIVEFFAGIAVIGKVYEDRADKALLIMNCVVFSTLSFMGF